MTWYRLAVDLTPGEGQQWINPNLLEVANDIAKATGARYLANASMVRYPHNYVPKPAIAALFPPRSSDHGLEIHPVTGKKATFCLIGNPMYHRPTPQRYVWHHNIPQVCGGPSDEQNLVNLCDNCHIIQHVLMWRMVFDTIGLRRDKWNRQHWNLASRGYAGAKLLGTEQKMPKLAAVAA